MLTLKEEMASEWTSAWQDLGPDTALLASAHSLTHGSTHSSQALQASGSTPLPFPKKTAAV